MKYFFHILIALIFSGQSVCAYAAPHMHLTLKQAIALGLRYNPNVQNAELQRILDKYSLRLAEWHFEPKYSVEGNLSKTFSKSDGDKSVLRSATVVPKTTLNTKVGTQLALSMTNPLTSGDYNPGVTLDVTQPLIRGFGTAVNTIELANAKDDEYLNRLSMRDEIQSAVVSIISNYRALMQSYNDLTIQKRALENAKKAVQKNEVRIQAGKMAPKDNVQAKADVAQNALALTQQINTVEQNKQTLLSDIGLDPNLTLSVDKDITVSKDDIPSYAIAIKYIKENDTAYQSLRIQKKKDERALLQAKDNKRWELNLDVDYTRGAGSGGGSNAGLKSLRNGRNYSQSTTLTFSVPIDDLSLENAIVSARVALEKDCNNIRQKERDLITAVKNARRNLKSKKEQIQLSELNVTLKRESLSIVQKKQSLGMASTLDVSTARDNLISAANTLVANKIQYLNALTSFYQKLGIILPKWGIKLRY